MGDYAQEVAGRLRILVDQVGGPSAFAARLGIRDTLLQDYLRAKSLPGNKMRQRLMSAGFDDFWVMYGSKEETDKKHKENVAAIYREAFPERARMVDVLQEFSIDAANKLREILEWWRSTARMVAETERRTKKKGGAR